MPCRLHVLFCLETACIQTVMLVYDLINPSMATLKPQSYGPLYSNTAIGTLAVDRAITFGTARRGLGGLRPRSGPSLLYQMSPPINGQCTNFTLFEVAPI